MTCTNAATIVMPTALVGDAVDRLRGPLLRAVRESSAPIITLDAEKVELISSSGLGLLVAAAMLARDLGKHLHAAHASEVFRASISLTGLAHHVSVDAIPAGSPAV